MIGRHRSPRASDDPGRRVQIVGDVVLTIVGLWAVASLVSPGLIPNAAVSWIALGGLGMGLVLSARGKTLRPVPVTARK